MYLLDNTNERVTSNISDDIKKLLIDKKIINTHGDILNISQYCHEITIARDDRLTKLNNIPIINGRLIDTKNAYVLLDEIRFLNNIAVHKKNFNDVFEYPKPRSYVKHTNKNVWQQVDRMRRKMLVVFRRRFR